MDREIIEVSALQLAAEPAAEAANPAAAVDRNLAHALQCIEELSRTADPDVIVLPKGAFQGRLPKGLAAADLAALAVRLPGKVTEGLGKSARRLGCYIAAAAYTSDEKDPGRVWSAACLVGPDGEMVLCYRQVTPERFDSDAPVLSVSEAPEGPADVRTLFPVARTPFGTLGCLIGPDINGFEVSKCLSYQGAEVLLHSAFAPPDWLAAGWCQAREARAYQSLAAVVSASPGAPPSGLAPSRGYAAVIDSFGTTVAQSDSALETAVTCRLDLAAIRKRRSSIPLNFVAQNRTDLFARAFGNFAASGG